MRRHLVIVSLLLVIGCDDGGAKAPPPLMPTSDNSATSDRSAPGEGEGDGEGEGTLVADDEAEPAPCGVSFTKDVMPKLAATCGTAACHQEAVAPSVDEATPQITFEALRDFGFDDPTWTDPHPADSKLAEQPELKAAIDGWRECGAPFE